MVKSYKESFPSFIPADIANIEWGSHPDLLADAGLQPPCPEVRQAIRFAMEAQERDYVPPTDVYPDPNGGIVFKLRQKNVAEKFHFWDDGTADYTRFENAKLVERLPLG